MAKPESGNLATIEDLETIMDLDAWLRATNPGTLKCNDAWNDGSTLSAFACNGFMGVEKRHADNTWVTKWDEGDDHISSPDLDQDNHGLFVYISDGPYKIEDLKPAEVTPVPQSNTIFNNTGSTQDNFTFSYECSVGTSTSLTVTEATSLTVDGGFELGPFTFNIKESFDHSQTKNNTQTTVNTTSVKIDVPVPANSNYAFTYTTYKTTQESLYGLDFSLGASTLADPPGGLAKATTPGQRASWDRYWTLDQLVSDGTTQTAQYNVTTSSVVTKIKSGPVADDGSINWGPEKTVTPDDPSGSGGGGPGGDSGGGDDGGKDDGVEYVSCSV